MARRVPAIVVMLLALASCSRFDRAERPAWRGQAEDACLARHLVEPSRFLQPARAIEGPGICGLDHPFRVYALAGGTVRLNAASLLDCPMVPTLDGWIRDVVQPAAAARFGEPVVQINTMGTYSCRGIDGERRGKLSEHAFANAIDVGGFVLRSGRELDVKRGWSGADEQEAAFLHDVHGGACGPFTTVLGPGADILHDNHIHLDLARHGSASHGARRFCRPEPRPAPPGPPTLAEDQDAADLPASPPLAGAASLDAAVPPAPEPDRDADRS